MQEQADGIIKPVAYYSCALSNQQQKWETFSKETYAVDTGVSRRKLKMKHRVIVGRI